MSDFVQRGRSLLAQKQYQEAVKVCRLGLLANPTLVEGRVILGSALLALGRHDEVLSEMRVSAELEPTNAQVFLLKGEALLRKGDFRQAAEVLARAQEIEPDNDRVRGLIDEAKRAKDAAVSKAAASALPREGFIDGETKTYPVHRGAGKGAEADGGEHGSGAITLPADAVENKKPAAQQRAPSVVPRAASVGPRVAQDAKTAVRPAPKGPPEIPTPEELAVGDRSGAIELHPDDMHEVEDSGARDLPATKVLEIGSGDIEEMFGTPPPSVDAGWTSPTKPVGAAARPSAPAAGAGAGAAPRRVAVLDDDDEEEDATLEEEEPAPTVERGERRSPAGAKETSDEYIVVNLATGANHRAEPEPRRAEPDPRRPRDIGFDGVELTTPASPRAVLAEASRLSLRKAVDRDRGADVDADEPLREPPLVFDDEDEMEGTTPGMPHNAKGAQQAKPATAQQAKQGPAQQPKQGPAQQPQARPGLAQQAKQGPAQQGKQGPAQPSKGPGRGAAGPGPAKGRPSASRPAVAPAGWPGASGSSMPGPSNPAGPISGPSMPPPRRDETPYLTPAGQPATTPTAALSVEQLARIPRPIGRGAEATGRTPRSGAEEVAPGRRVSWLKARTDGLRLRGRLGRGPFIILAGTAALLIVAVLIGIGLWVRHRRIERQLRALATDAETAASDQTYRGYTRAEALYRTILSQRSDKGIKQELLRTRAALAAEFGEPLSNEDAAAISNAARDQAAGRRALVAAVYRALVDDDGPAAVRLAREAAARSPQDPEVAYLVGRALALEEDPAAAGAELLRSVSLKGTPLAYTALGSAEAAQGRSDAALAAFDKALSLVPQHPSATIERARLLAMTGRLPDANHPEEELTALLREVAQRDATKVPAASPAQVGWASLALAEVKLARGDLGAARKALAVAAESRPPRDRRFSESLVAALLAAGDTAGARAEAEHTAQTWPQQGGPRVWLARVALAERKPDVALAELDKAGAAGARSDALAVRGQAKVMLGDLDGAGRDLDAALAARPGDRAALLARALVDLRKGDPRSAVARLEPLYAAGGADVPPDVVVAYGAALRAIGDRAKARTILEQAAAMPRGGDAYMELARLDRDEGRFADSRQAYARAIELAPGRLDGRLEAATLARDLGDAAGARAALDQLAVDAPQDPQILLECARIRAATGDRTGARKLVDDASRLPLAPRGLVARENGRLLLLGGQAAAALEELKKAVQAEPDDGDARLLMLDALIVASGSDVAPAQAALVEIAKRFFGRPEEALARGRVHLAKGEAPLAIAAFASAEKLLRERNAPPRLVADALTWIGRGWDNQGDLGKAQNYFNQAAQLDPSNAEALYYLGLMNQWQDRFADANVIFGKAIAADPENAEAEFSFGETGMRIPAKRAAARAALEKYLQLAPKGDNAATARALLKQFPK